jgi:hypothetical protein
MTKDLVYQTTQLSTDKLLEESADLEFNDHDERMLAFLNTQLGDCFASDKVTLDQFRKMCHQYIFVLKAAITKARKKAGRAS